MDYPQNNINNNVQFDAEQISAMTALYKKTHNVSGSNSKMINFLIKRKIIKNEKVGSLVLIGIAALAFILTAYFLHSALKTQVLNPIVGKEIIKK